MHQSVEGLWKQNTFDRQGALSESGFTLLEAMVAVGIMVILSTIAIPRLQLMTASFQRMNTRAFLVRDLKRSQAESVTQGCRGIFKIDADGRGYEFGCDYLSYDADANPNYDTMSFRRNLPSMTKVTANQNVIFNSRGQVVNTSNDLTAPVFTFEDKSSGSYETFASGSLLTTGVFVFD